MFGFVVSVLFSTGVGDLVSFVSDSVCVCGVSGVENELFSLDELVCVCGVSGVENELSSLDELVCGDGVSLIYVMSGVSFADLVRMVVRFVSSVRPGTCFRNALAVDSFLVRAVVVVVVLSVWLEY